MTVADGEILKAVLEFVLADGTIIQNVLHFLADFTSDQGNTDVKNACKSYGEGLYADIDAHVDAGVTTNPMTVHVVVWDGVAGEWVTDRLVGTATPSITFTGATDPLPNQCSPVIVGNTVRPKSRGRKFLAPFLDVSADGSDWVSAVVTNLGLALAAYLSDETVTGDSVLSPGVPRTAEDLFLEFTDGIVNSIVGTQRRRKPGVGA